MSGTATTSTLSEETCNRWRFYWASELAGCRFFLSLMRYALPSRVNQLSRHAADEAKHVKLWAAHLDLYGVAAHSQTPTLQSLLTQRARIPRSPASMVAMAMTIEEMALREYQEKREGGRVYDSEREVLKVMVKDEPWHIEWLYEWGQELSGDFRSQLRYYREIGRGVYYDLKTLGGEYVRNDPRGSINRSIDMVC